MARQVPSEGWCDVDAVLAAGGATQLVLIKVECRPLRLGPGHIEVSVTQLGGESELEVSRLSEGVVSVVPLLHLPGHAVANVVRPGTDQGEC